MQLAPVLKGGSWHVPLAMSHLQAPLHESEPFPCGHVEQLFVLWFPHDTAEYVPAAQSTHAADPVAVLYFPVAQKVHGPPSGPVHPALQVHAVKLLLPAGDMDRAAQSVHVPSPFLLPA